MCWACYTPLTEGGAATGGPAVGGHGAGPPMDDDEAPAKKAVEPWQMGVIGLFLAIVLFVGVRTLMGGGSSSGDSGETPAGVPDPGVGNPPDPGTNPQSAPSVTWPAGSGAPEPGYTSPFKMVSPPYPNVRWATMAIVPTNSNLSTTQAAALAGFARQRVVNPQRWAGFTIYVFADEQSAQVFKDSQIKRRGQPPMSADYQELRSIWSRTLAVYDYSKGYAGVRLPRTNPNGWWTSKPKMTPVKS
jgi:hypothetical protein